MHINVLHIKYKILRNIHVLPARVPAKRTKHTQNATAACKKRANQNKPSQNQFCNCIVRMYCIVRM